MNYYQPRRDPLNLAVLENRDGVQDWLDRLKRGPLAVDTETTGLSWIEDRVAGLCLASGETATYFTKDAMAPAVRWLSRQFRTDRTIVFHNGKFDLHQLRGTFGLTVSRPVDDTMVMGFILDDRGAPGTGYFGGHELPQYAAAFVDPNAMVHEDELRQAVIAAGGRRGKKTWKADMHMAPLNLIGKYGAYDAWYTLQLYHQFVDRIRHWSQPYPNYPSLWSLYENEKWLLIALLEMERRGIRVRTEFFEKWNIELEERISSIESQLESMTGESINWGSTKQLGELLFDKMDLMPSRYTKSGNPSTDEVSLLNLDHPIGAILLQLRYSQKQKSTYAEGLLRAATAYGRIHTRFKQTGAVTGRMSSVDPNLQQVPRESGARRGFIPDDGMVLRFADYSQAEMRFAAHESGDKVLVHGFKNNPKFDTHAATAMKMWGMKKINADRNKVHKRRRKFAKIMNFGMLYGAGLDRVTEQLISMLDLQEVDVAIREFGEEPNDEYGNTYRALGALLLDRYFKEFPAIKDVRYRASDEAKRLGYAVNVYGRHRYLGENEAYKALNSKIQGAAVDLAKKGLVGLFRELQLGEGSIALLLQIHDEAVYLSDGDPKTDRKALEILNDYDSFEVPMLSDMSGSETSWQEKVGIEL